MRKIFNYFFGVVISIMFISTLIFFGWLLYTFFGEDYLLIPLSIFCAGIFFAILFQSTKNSLKEEKTFVEIIEIIFKNLKEERKNILGGIFFLVLLALLVVYKTILLNIFFTILYGIVSFVGFVSDHVLILLLTIITLTLIGIYNRLKK